jgi:hypothetical protein
MLYVTSKIMNQDVNEKWKHWKRRQLHAHFKGVGALGKMSFWGLPVAIKSKDFVI